MSGTRQYYQQGAANGLFAFFNNDKRLALLKPLLPNIHALQQDLNRPLKILDIGAGTGLHAAYLAKGGHQVTAVDPIDEMLIEAQTNYKDLKMNFVVDSLPNLAKMGNEKFDVIYSIAAWQYLAPADRQAAMERITQLLEPGGLFAIIWPSPMSRAFQYPLTHEDLNKSMNIINKKRSPDHQIVLTQSEPMKDPDNRKGFLEKNQDVYFNTAQGQMPMPALRNEFRKTAGK